MVRENFENVILLKGGMVTILCASGQNFFLESAYATVFVVDPEHIV